MAPDESILKGGTFTQAQGLWRMLQCKPKDEQEERAQRAERERQDKLKIDDEWAGGSKGKLHHPTLPLLHGRLTEHLKRHISSLPDVHQDEQTLNPVQEEQ